MSDRPNTSIDLIYSHKLIVEIFGTSFSAPCEGITLNFKLDSLSIATLAQKHLIASINQVIKEYFTLIRCKGHQRHGIPRERNTLVPEDRLQSVQHLNPQHP